MSQEYHNRITIEGSPDQRLKLFADVFANPPANWEWVGITINEAASRGKDSGKALLDFWSRKFPEGLGDLSLKFPGITFDCDLLDVTAESGHHFTLVNGMESECNPVIGEVDYETSEEQEAKHLQIGDKKFTKQEVLEQVRSEQSGGPREECSALEAWTKVAEEWFHDWDENEFHIYGFRGWIERTPEEILIDLDDAGLIDPPLTADEITGLIAGK